MSQKGSTVHRISTSQHLLPQNGKLLLFVGLCYNRLDWSPDGPKADPVAYPSLAVDLPYSHWGTSGEPQLCCGGVFLQSKPIASRSGGSVYFSPCLPLTSLRPLSRQTSLWEGSWHPQSVAGKNPRRHLEALSGLMLGETMGSTEASRALRLALPTSQLLAPQPFPGIPKARDRLLRQVESHLKKTNSKYTSHALNLWSDCESIIA